MNPITAVPPTTEELPTTEVPPITEVKVPIEVRYAETDSMGLVHHSRYLVWLEVARTRLCQETGFHYAEIEAMGTLLVVTRADLSYRQGARYGESVEVLCRLGRLASRGLSFDYEVRRGDALLVTATTEHIWVDAQTRRPCRIPEVLRPGFEALRRDRTGSNLP